MLKKAFICVVSTKAITSQISRFTDLNSHFSKKGNHWRMESQNSVNITNQYRLNSKKTITLTDIYYSIAFTCFPSIFGTYFMHQVIIYLKQKTPNQKTL